MAKVVFKQVMLTLLVTIAVGLFFIIVFYNVIPANKLIPSKVQEYQTPNSISAEIESSIGGEDKNSVYEITSADISAYKNSNIYEPGKVDPFDSIEGTENVATANATSSTTVNTNNNGNTATTTRTTNGDTTTTTTTNGSRTTTTTTRTTTNSNTSSSTSSKTNTTSKTEDNYYKASGISKGGK